MAQSFKSPDASADQRTIQRLQQEVQILRQQVQKYEAERFYEQEVRRFQEQNVDRFRTIFDQTFQFIALLNPDGFLIEANQSALAFGGLTRSQVVGQPFWQARWWTLSLETQARLRRAIAQARSGEFVRYEVEVLGAENISTVIDFSLQPVQDETGQVRWLVAEGRDICGLQQAEETLNSFFDSASTMMGIVELVGDEDVIHIRDNAAAAQFLGMSPEQLRQKRTSEIGTAPEYIQFWIQQYRRSEQIQAPVQFEYCHRYGAQACWLAATVCPIKTNLRATPRFAYIVEDISDRKQAEAERRRIETEVHQLNAKLERRVRERTAELEAVNSRLEQEIRDRKQFERDLQQRATELEQVNQLLTQTTLDLERRNRELDKFAYVASHDLKAPLRAISNLSEWIEDDAGDRLSDDSKYHLQLLRKRVNRMEMLIVALLRFSRAGRITARKEAVNVNALLADVLELLAPADGFTIHVDPMPTLTAQRQVLHQIFFNLVGNAIKHGDRQASDIWVTVEERDDYYEFRVADNGPGIAPRYHDKIFEIFQTLKPRDELEAAGIGLSLVKKLVETEGGSIWLESDVGQGATFYFTWPK